jgi:predicted ribosome quality control (RQC) complex YloA/Tae2 family protein
MSARMKTLLINSVTYYIGKTQQENHDVIDIGTPSDLWFHLADTSSCHVVAVVPPNVDRKARGKIIKQGALLCKQNTAKAASQQKVTVTYAPLSAVTKESTPGSVLVTESRTIVV